MTASDHAAWALFADWCAASGRRALPARPEDVAAFLHQVPGSPSTALHRVRAIRRAHAHAGVVDPTSEPSPIARDRPTRSGPRWLDVAETMARCPTTGGGGIRGRRDAVVILAHQVLNLPARAVARLSTDVIDASGWTIADQPIPYNVTPRLCGRCVLARWIDVHRQLVPLASRGGAQQVVLAPVTAGHRCERPVGLPHPGAALLVGLDRHGWPAGPGLSARTVARVGALRMSRDAPTLPASTRPAGQRADGVVVRRELDDLLVELEKVAARIEQVQEEIAGSTAWAGARGVEVG